MYIRAPTGVAWVVNENIRSVLVDVVALSVALRVWLAAVVVNRARLLSIPTFVAPAVCVHAPPVCALPSVPAARLKSSVANGVPAGAAVTVTDLVVVLVAPLL